MMTPLLHAATELPALLRAAWQAGLGKRHQAPVAAFLMDAERECQRLQEALRAPIGAPGAFRPGAPKRFWIRDPKPRLITEVPFVDRVVHHALCAQAEPHLERYAIFDTYACRWGKGHHAALRRAQRFARSCDARWALRIDIAAFFPSIPHDPLLALVQRRVPDAGLCAWLEVIVRAGGGERGLPIGAAGPLFVRSSR